MSLSPAGRRRRPLQNLGMLALHILPVAIVYANTLMLRDLLAERDCSGGAHAHRR
jgi:TnpA family transposase